jgi:hypothetical protein
MKVADPENKWRTKYKSDKRVFVTVRISEEMRDKLQEIFSEYDCTLNSYVRECLRLLIIEEGK